MIVFAGGDLIMCKSISEWVQRFRKGIRRAGIEETKARRRKELIQQISREELMASFKGTATQGFLSLSTIFQNCQSLLLTPIPLHSFLIDEKTVLPIGLHVQLLHRICEDLSHSSREGDYECLASFIEEMMNRYSATQLHKEIEYQVEFYNLIYYALDRLSMETKEKLVEWVETKESLWIVGEVIGECEEINCESHPHLFTMMEEGLASKDELYQADAALLLAKVVKYYDQRDLLRILQSYKSIPQQLIDIIATRISQKRYASIIDFWSPLLFLFQTFDEALFPYYKAGIIGTCSQMIATNDPSCIFGAMELLNRFCLIKDENVKQALFYDEEMGESKMWMDSCLRNNVTQHENISIRRSCARLMRNVMRNANERQLYEIAGRFMQRGESLMVWLQGMLKEQDLDLLAPSLQCVERLLYSEQSTEIDHLSSILFSLDRTSIPSLISSLTFHPNTKIRQTCGDLQARFLSLRRSLSI